VVRLSSPVTGGIIADAVRIENTTTPAAPVSDADIVRFLEQATFGPNDTSIQHVRDLGSFDAWIFEQFDSSITPISSYPTLPLVPDNQNLTCPNTLPQQERDQCIRNNFSAYPIQTRFFVNAMYGPDQLRQRVAWALHHIIVTSARDDLSHPSRMTPYLQLFDQYAFDTYPNILAQITLNPAMGRYLDMATST